jgi:Protein of unknown function (DUF2975)
MKRETLFLKVALFLLGIPVLALCIFGLPVITKEAAEYLEMTFLQVPLLLGLYVAAIAYFVALYQAFRLLSYIDRNDAFSELSVIALQKIKYCAITISILFVVKMPVIFLIADKDDAPGLIIIGLVIIFAPIVIAVFAAVLQKLLKNAIDIKSENDLTV